MASAYFKVNRGAPMSDSGFDGKDLNKVRQTIIGMFSRWGLTAIIPALLVLAVVLLLANGGALVFLFNLFFGFEKQHDFFYQTLGMNDAWSTVLARIMQFVTALGWVPLLVYFPRRRLDVRTTSVSIRRRVPPSSGTSSRTTARSRFTTATDSIRAACASVWRRRKSVRPITRRSTTFCLVFWSEIRTR
jgi:hypothetical protein